MLRLFLVVVVIVAALSISSCKKDSTAGSTILTGIWIKGTQVGDTLHFTTRDGKNVLRFNASFNPALAAFTETEYRYQNGQLSVKNFMAGQNDFYPIESFAWKQEGKEFELLGYQLFPFMSSTVTRFIYRKIN